MADIEDTEQGEHLEFEAPPEIISAAFGGDAEWVQAILERDPSQAETRDDFLGTTPLIIASHRWATQQGFRDIVAALLDAGAQVNARERASGTTALHWAAEAGNPDLIDILAEKGADLAAADSWYNLAPLGWATLVDWAPDFRNDREGAADKLLALGVRLDPFSAVILNEAGRLRGAIEEDPAIVSERLGFVGQGQQPLHLAVVRGNREMAEVLIDGGADVNSLSGWGVSALAMARAGKDDWMVDRLTMAGATPDLSYALYSSDWDAARALPFDERHKYLLHAAAKAGRKQAVELLLERGADPKVQVAYLLDELPGELSASEVAAQAGHDGIGELLKRE